MNKKLMYMKLFFMMSCFFSFAIQASHGVDTVDDSNKDVAKQMSEVQSYEKSVQALSRKYKRQLKKIEKAFHNCNSLAKDISGLDGVSETQAVVSLHKHIAKKMKEDALVRYALLLKLHKIAHPPFMQEKDEDLKKRLEDCAPTTDTQLMALIDAINAGDLAEVKSILKSCTLDLNRFDDHFYPPLFYAIMHNQKDMVIALTDAGASVNVRYFDGTVPLLLIGKNRDGIKAILLNLGADIDLVNEQGETPLATAVGTVQRYDSTRVVDALLSRNDISLTKKIKSKTIREFIDAAFNHAQPTNDKSRVLHAHILSSLADAQSRLEKKRAAILADLENKKRGGSQTAAALKDSMDKFESPEESTGQGKKAQGATASDSAAKEAVKRQHIDFTPEELKALEIRAQAYINVVNLEVDLGRWPNPSDQKLKFLKKFILKMNRLSMERFLSFFKNKKNISGDEFFGNTLFASLKARTGQKAQKVFKMLEAYSKEVRVDLQTKMNKLSPETSAVAPLIDAICALDAQEIQALLKSGISPLQFDDNKYAPIHYAMLFEKDGLIELLAEDMKDDQRKQLVNFKNNKGLIPLLLVGPNANEARALLEKYGPDINFVDAQCGQTPLQTAILATCYDPTNVDLVLALVAHKARVTQADYDFAFKHAEQIPKEDFLVKKSFDELLSVFKGKIKEREELEVKLKALKKTGERGTAAAGTGDSRSAAISDKNSKKDTESEKTQFDEKQISERIAQLNKADFEDLEIRAKAFLNVDKITAPEKISGAIRDATTILLQELETQMVERRFARFFSFFKDKGLMGHASIDKKVLKKIAKKASPNAKKLLGVRIAGMDKESELTIAFTDGNVVEDTQLERFIDAVCANDQKEIDRHLKEKFNPNQFDGWHFAPLYYAVMLNQKETVQKLLKAPVRADINLINGYGLSSLLVIHPFMNAKMHEWLISHKAELNYKALESAIQGVDLFKSATKQKNDGKLLVIGALVQRGVKVPLELKSKGLTLYNSAKDDKDKSLYREMLAMLGLTIFDSPNMNRHLKGISQICNIGSRGGTIPGMGNAINLGISATELHAVAMDDSAIEQFMLSQEEMKELEIIAQACLNSRICSEKIDKNKKTITLDDQFALLAQHCVTAGVQVRTQFNNFFMARKINPAKFQYDDFKKRVQEKIGKKAAEYLAVMAASMKEQRVSIDFNFTQLESDKKLLSLIAALMAQDVSRVKELLKNGAPAAREDDYKLLPMHYAIMSALVDPTIADDLIRTLIEEYKVDANTPNFFGSAPILLAHSSLQLKNPALLKPAIAQTTLIRAIYASRLQGTLIAKELIKYCSPVGEKECKLIADLLLKSQRLPQGDPNKIGYVANSFEMQKILREAKRKASDDEKARVQAQIQEKRDKKQARQAKNKEGKGSTLAAKEAADKALQELHNKQCAHFETAAAKALSLDSNTDRQISKDLNVDHVSNPENPHAQESVAVSAAHTTKLALTEKEMEAYKEEKERALRAHHKKMAEESGKAIAILFNAYVPPTRATQLKVREQGRKPTIETPTVKMSARQTVNNAAKSARIGISTENDGSRSGSLGISKTISASAAMRDEIEQTNKRLAQLKEQKKKEQEETESKEKEQARKSLEQEIQKQNDERKQMQEQDTYVMQAARPMPTAAPVIKKVEIAQAPALVVPQIPAPVPTESLRIKREDTPSMAQDIPIFDATVRHSLAKPTPHNFQKPTAKLLQDFKKLVAQKAQEKEKAQEDDKRAQELALLAQDQARIKARADGAKQKREELKQKAKVAAEAEGRHPEAEMLALQVALRVPISLKGTAQDIYETHIKDYNLAQRIIEIKQQALWKQCGGEADNFQNPPINVLDKYQKLVGPLTFENRYSFNIFDSNNRPINGNDATFTAWLKAHHKLVQGTGCNTCCRFDYATLQQVQQLCASA